mmetsp:Transcript_63135/g.104974  ORF Transcript_63135/g.104974 Transcript_63135/m.104974 type:complete len:459 (+) Transcript_63135:120-1496(+)
MARSCLVTAIVLALLVSILVTLGCITLTTTWTHEHPQRLLQRTRAIIAKASEARRRNAALPHRSQSNATTSKVDSQAEKLPPCKRSEDERCAQWAETGECSRNPHFMLRECARACGKCTGRLQVPSALASAKPFQADPGCEDKSSFCGEWAAIGECDSNPNYMKFNCRVTCHLCQSAACHDVDRDACAARVAAGQCRREPEIMYSECRWSCGWCAMTTDRRCLRKNSAAAASVGTLHAMFERAVAPEHQHYKPMVLSREPWIVAFESFLSDDEAHRVIDVGGRNWGRSQAGDGVQAVRTSSTSWCEHSSRCGSDPVLQELRKRIANLTMVPENNAEHLQVLRYEPGQFYRRHHDQNSPITSAWGPRLYTFFMYLNEVEEGGETNFPLLNISVRPKRGRALLWPSVLNHEPTARDDRTEHEAIAVNKGTKFAANYWLHLHDFQEPARIGCGNEQVFGNW